MQTYTSSLINYPTYAFENGIQSILVTLSQPHAQVSDSKSVVPSQAALGDAITMIGSHPIETLGDVQAACDALAEPLRDTESKDSGLRFVLITSAIYISTLN